MECNSNVWAGVSRYILKLLDRLQGKAKVPINDNRLSNSIHSLEHRRNVACVIYCFFDTIMGGVRAR